MPKIANWQGMKLVSNRSDSSAHALNQFAIINVQLGHEQPSPSLPLHAITPPGHLHGDYKEVFQACLPLHFQTPILEVLEVRDLALAVSNLQPVGHMQPRMAVNAAQHKIVNLSLIHI